MFAFIILIYFIIGAVILEDIPRNSRIQYLLLLLIWPVLLLLVCLEPLWKRIVHALRRTRK